MPTVGPHRRPLRVEAQARPRCPQPLRRPWSEHVVRGLGAAGAAAVRAAYKVGRLQPSPCSADPAVGSSPTLGDAIVSVSTSARSGSLHVPAAEVGHLRRGRSVGYQCSRRQEPSPFEPVPRLTSSRPLAAAASSRPAPVARGRQPVLGARSCASATPVAPPGSRLPRDRRPRRRQGRASTSAELFGNQISMPGAGTSHHRLGADPAGLEYSHGTLIASTDVSVRATSWRSLPDQASGGPCSAGPPMVRAHPTSTASPRAPGGRPGRLGR